MRALGFDIGTTTISAVIIKLDNGNVERSYTIGNDSFISTEYDWEKIQDPDVILKKAFKLLDEIFEEYDDIQMIGLTGQMHGIVYLDENGRHVSPLYTWQDRRGDLTCFEDRSICEIIEDEFSVKAHTGYGLITHLYNLRQNQVPKEAVQICTIMDYLGMVMTGRTKPLVHSSNAASMGLYDTEKGGFLERKLKRGGIDTGILPEVTDSFVIIGTYREIPVSVAIGDNQASFLGSVKDASDSILVNMGTGGQISILSDTYFTAKGIEARPFVEQWYLLAGSSLCGGRAYATLERFFRSYAETIGVYDVDHYAVMEKLLGEKREAGKLKVTTTFSGTREKPDKRGSIKNIGTTNFTPAALTLGVLEGMAAELRNMYSKIEKGLHISKSRIIASGNGIRRNRYLQEIMSEQFGMSLQMAEHEEEAAYGAAVSAMIASGHTTLKKAIGV